jgi:hypothetical protein
MHKNLESMETNVQDRKNQLPHRVWVKPEAKAAEVAQATLAGHTSTPISDFVTCAS